MNQILGIEHFSFTYSMAGQDSQNIFGGEGGEAFAEMDHSVNSGLVLRCLQCLKVGCRLRV